MGSLFPSPAERIKQQRERIRLGAQDNRSFVKSFLGLGQDHRNRKRIWKDVRAEMRAARRGVTQRNNNEARARLQELRRNPSIADQRALKERRQDLENHYNVTQYKEGDPRRAQASKYVEAKMKEFVRNQERQVRQSFLKKADEERKAVGREYKSKYEQQVQELQNQYKSVQSP